MDELLNILNNIKNYIKEISNKSRENYLIVIIIIFLKYVSIDVQCDFKKKVYSILIFAFIIMLIIMNNSYLKEFFLKNLWKPISKIFFNQSLEEKENAKELLKY